MSGKTSEEKPKIPPQELKGEGSQNAKAQTREKLAKDAWGTSGTDTAEAKVNGNKESAPNRKDADQAESGRKKAEKSNGQAEKVNGQEKEDLSDLAARLKMTGTLVFKDKEGNLHQALVNHGFVISDEDKIAGVISPDGEVDFNQYGQNKYKVDPKLNIKTSDGAIFHSLNPAVKDIVSEKTQRQAEKAWRQGNENWSGTFYDVLNNPDLNVKAEIFLICPVYSRGVLMKTIK